MNKLLTSLKNAERPIRVIKRDKQKTSLNVALYLLAIVLSLAIGAILLASLKVDVFDYYKNMFSLGMIGNKFAYKSIENFIKVFVPLLITSLGLSLAFKMRFWNIGGEGQFIVGAITASAIALGIDTTMSPYLMVMLMALGGGLTAALYGVFTAVLKVKFGTNETLLTLMLNYIALYVLYFFGETQATWNIFLNNTSIRPVFDRFPGSALMPTIPIGENFQLNIALIIALAFAVLIFIYLNKTKHGFEVSVVGDSPNTARYAGMKVGKIVIRTMFVSAFLVGVAGAFKVSTAGTLSTAITSDVGWTGIVVAWLAKLNPIGIIIVGFLISILQFGCTVAGTSFTQIDSNFANLLQGIILFVVLASDFFIKYKLVFNFRKRNHLIKQNSDSEQVSEIDSQTNESENIAVNLQLVTSLEEEDSTGTEGDK